MNERIQDRPVHLRESVTRLQPFLPQAVFSTGHFPFLTASQAASRICAEDAWGVETRQAQPIDRPVQPNQSGGPHVADDTVILDWLISHGSRPNASFCP